MLLKCLRIVFLSVYECTSTVFHTFLNLVGVWEDFPTELRAHPPYLHPFSDFTFEEVVGAEEPAH